MESNQTSSRHIHLWEVALLINQSQQVAGISSQKVQNFLVVTKADVVPHNVIFRVLFLLQLEDVAHKELLQLFVGEIYAQLFKTVKMTESGLLSSWRIETCWKTTVKMFDTCLCQSSQSRICPANRWTDTWTSGCWPGSCRWRCWSFQWSIWTAYCR